jgi:hypothetical protein
MWIYAEKRTDDLLRGLRPEARSAGLAARNGLAALPGAISAIALGATERHLESAP